MNSNLEGDSPISLWSPFSGCLPNLSSFRETSSSYIYIYICTYTYSCLSVSCLQTPFEHVVLPVIFEHVCCLFPWGNSTGHHEFWRLPLTWSSAFFRASPPWSSGRAATSSSRSTTRPASGKRRASGERVSGESRFIHGCCWDILETIFCLVWFSGKSPLSC